MKQQTNIKIENTNTIENFILRIHLSVDRSVQYWCSLHLPLRVDNVAHNLYSSMNILIGLSGPFMQTPGHAFLAAFSTSFDSLYAFKFFLWEGRHMCCFKKCWTIRSFGLTNVLILPSGCFLVLHTTHR